METMMQSAVCLLEQAAEKFKNKTVFEDKDGSISFEELREKSRIIGSELIKRVETGRKCRTPAKPGWFLAIGDTDGCRIYGKHSAYRHRNLPWRPYISGR